VIQFRLPFLHWPRLTGPLARSEAAAALTVALVMIPQSVAYAGLAGMPLIAGLYASFLPPLLSVMFSASTRLSVGPSALSSVLVGTSLVGLAAPESPQWVALAVWMALLSGGVQFAVGAMNGAWLLNLVSSPILAGFSQAAALLIILSQLPTLIGLHGGLHSLIANPVFDARALAFGIASLALFLAGKRFAPRVPMLLLVLLASAALANWSGYSASGSVVGELPAGFPSLYWPGLPAWHDFQALVVPALVIALVSSLEMAASAKIESQRDGKRWDARQDLVGQGVGKLTSALCGSFPTSTSFSRSAITLYSGAKTGWATVFATAFIALALLFFTPVLRHVPRAVLAAVVVAAVLGLVKPRTFARLARIDRVEAAIALVTFVVTLLAAPRIYWGVLTGVIAGLAHFLYLRLHPRIIEVGLHPDGSLRDRHLWSLAPLGGDVCALRMDGELDFASATSFEEALVDHLAAHPRTAHVVLFAQPINRVDATGVETFVQLRAMLETRGIALHVSGIKLPVERVLERAGALTPSPLLHMYRTDSDALEALRRQATSSPSATDGSARPDR
jgi:sulfate permease, SulP family